MNPTCPRCGSDRWLNELVLVSETRPCVAVKDATLWQPPKGFSRTRAEGCGYCGYLEFFMTEPAEVDAAWDECHRSNLPLPAGAGELGSRNLPRPHPLGSGPTQSPHEME